MYASTIDLLQKVSRGAVLRLCSQIAVSAVAVHIVICAFSAYEHHVLCHPIDRRSPRHLVMLGGATNVAATSEWQGRISAGRSVSLSAPITQSMKDQLLTIGVEPADVLVTELSRAAASLRTVSSRVTTYSVVCSIGPPFLNESTTLSAIRNDRSVHDDSAVWSDGSLWLVASHGDPATWRPPVPIPIIPRTFALVLVEGALGIIVVVACRSLVGLKEWSRRRRGCCPHCSHPIPDHRGICAECGFRSPSISAATRGHG
jgi:hypothetical protein